MDSKEHRQILDFLRNSDIPSDLEPKNRKNFIRKCRAYRIGEEDKLYKVTFISFLNLGIFNSWNGTVPFWNSEVSNLRNLAIRLRKLWIPNFPNNTQGPGFLSFKS